MTKYRFICLLDHAYRQTDRHNGRWLLRCTPACKHPVRHRVAVWIVRVGGAVHAARSSALTNALLPTTAGRALHAHPSTSDRHRILLR